MNAHTPPGGTIHGAAPLIPIGNKEQSRLRGYVALAATDAVAIAVSFLAANILVLGNWTHTHGTTMLSVLLPLYLWMAAANGSYNGEVLRDPRIGAIKAMRALAFAGAALLIIAYSFKVGAAFSRLVFWTGALSAGALLVAARLAVGRLLLRAMGGSPFSTVVVTDGLDWTGDPHGVVVDAARIGFDPTTDDPFHYHGLAELIAHADRVLIACRDDRVVAWAQVLKSMAVDGEILAPDVDRIGMIGVGHYRDRRTLVVSAGPLHLRARIVKRAFDLVVSATALVLLSPLLVGVAIAVRLETPGPALFRQQRIGRDNKLFMMFKFRSMFEDRCDPSAVTLTARADDLTNRLSSDLEYLRDWSMGRDLWILFRTVFVIRHDNAF